MKKTIFLFLVLSLIITPITYASTLHKSLKMPVSFLGGGYSDDMQAAVGRSCLKPGEISLIADPGAVSQIQLGNAVDFNMIQKELNANISADANIGLFSGDAQSNYAKYISSNNYSESFYYLEKLNLPTKIISTEYGVDALNAFGLNAYKAGPEQFRLSCGNRYYKQVNLGLRFIATLKVIFNSAFDKTLFNASLGSGVGNFVSAEASIQQIAQQNNIHGRLEVSVYQEGGDPTKLANIFSKCANNYCVLSCSLDDLNACKSTLDGIINYARDSLPAQIGYDAQTNTISGSPAPLYYDTEEYSRLGLEVGYSELTPEIIASRQYLGHLYKETLHNEEIVDHILNSGISANISIESKDRLRALSEALHNNAAMLADDYNGAIGCYLSPKNCVAIRNQIDTLLKPIDTEILNIFRIGYIDRTDLGPYLVTPIGGDQYQSFRGGSLFTSQATIRVINNGNVLHVEGMNINRDILRGDLNKVGENTFIGDIHYSNGMTFRSQFTRVENPI